MKIIELYGYSGSGKSFKANKIAKKKKLDSNFLQISKKKRIPRVICKIIFIINIKKNDLIFVSNIHKLMKIKNFIFILKNFFSFIYVIGFIRNYKKKKRSIILDHGLFQCLYGCLLVTPKDKILDRKLAKLFKEYLKVVFSEINYKVIRMNTNLNIINKRLIKDKNDKKKNYLMKNKKKIIETYTRISFIIKNI